MPREFEATRSETAFEPGDPTSVDVDGPCLGSSRSLGFMNGVL